MSTISVCICTYNRANMLAAALESIFRQVGCEGVSYEVVVVDDGSTDATPSLLARLASPVPFRHVRQENMGVASARNRSVREAAGEWIAFFDDDEIASPGWLCALYRSGTEGGADYVGGPCRIVLLDSNTPLPTGTARRLLGENNLLVKSRFWRMRPSTINPGTGNALVKREIFFREGGFREGLLFGEDFLFFRRLSKAEYKLVIAPDAIVQHLIPSSRLTLEYLIGLARKSAAFRAQVDWEEGNAVRAVFYAVLRLAQAFIFQLPKAILGLVLQRDNLVLNARLSGAYTREYWRACLHRTLLYAKGSK